MTVVANNPGEFSLGSLNDSTGWIDIRGVADDFTFNISGTWSGTITLEASNQSDYTKTRTSTVTTYTANTAPRGLPRVGRFVRFKMTSYVSGAAYVGFSEAKMADGRLIDLAPQSNTNDPTGLFQ